MIAPIPAIIKNLFSALICSTLGGLVGFLLFLGITSIHYGKMPNERDFRAIPFILVIGFLVGFLFAPIVLMFIGRPIRQQWKWSFAFLLLGAIAGPIIFIAIVAYSMSGTGGW